MALTHSRLISGSILDEQVQLETQAVRAGVLRYRQLAREAVRRGEGAALKPAERLLLHWYVPLVEAIREERRAIRRGEPGPDRAIYGPTLLLVDAERLAVITMHETVSRCMSAEDGVLVSQLCYAIGRAVFAEANMDMFKQGNRDQLRQLERRVRRLNPLKVNWWAKRTLDDPKWERAVAAKLGACLLWLLIGTASADDYDKPFKLAFHHRMRRLEKKSVAYIEMDREVSDIIDEGHAIREHLRPRYLPMVVPPYPWQDDAQGGYVRIRTPFIIKPTPKQKEALRQADLSQVYECLNALAATPWRINRRILDVARQVWHAGGGVAGVPHRDNFPLPPRPDDIDTNDESRAKWRREAADVYARNHRLKAPRKEFAQKIAVAEQMVDREAIYYPHQLDFRGRCYPIPPHLNHQGDDLCRGLLEYAEPRPPRQPGLWWLFVHMANCCGVDKCSFAQRVEWVKANMATLAGWVEDPLVNTGWMEADKPWQALATAMALDDPDAAAHLPVQVDGTCNGLQHYAAMGRDPEGAEAVNLIGGPAPRDIYAQVAVPVARVVEQDAAAGMPEAQWIAGHIDRSVVKHVVMTSVYGVTMVGARQQIYRAIDRVSLEDEQRYRVSMYLGNVTLRAIGGVCPAAAAIMDWLRRCAQQISRDAGQAVRWTTPLGLPVVQPYRNYSPFRVKTILQTLTLMSMDDEAPVAPGRQADGVAPNFVHSIDATHMMMTARACHRAGIHFAAVHDSYWCHAADADRMGRILREQFVTLHSRPLLHDLRTELERNHNLKLPDPPPTGTLDIRQVLDSPYFFS